MKKTEVNASKPFTVAWNIIKAVLITLFIVEIAVVYFYRPTKNPIRMINIFTSQTSQTVQRRLNYNFEISLFNNNPIYTRFNITNPKIRKRVTVLIIVSTAPRRYDRRQAIRETWWRHCKQTNEVRINANKNECRCYHISCRNMSKILLRDHCGLCSISVVK